MAAARSRCQRLSIVAVLLLVATVSAQEEYQFLSEPPEYQYSYPDRVTLFPCEATMTDDNDNQRVIDTTLYRNQRFMDIYFPPPRHRAWANHDGMVIGIEVNPTKLEDSGTTYQCVIMRNNRTLLRSRRTRLFVGDGRPLAVTVEQLEQSLYSLTLRWSPAPVPSDAPVLGYTVLVTEQSGRSFEVQLEGNDTTVDLLHLTPGRRYGVVVFARNAYGQGARSEQLDAYTVRSEAPFRPKNVSATAEVGESSSSITVSWTLSQIEPEVMTPVERYIIFYGLSRNSLQNISMADNTTTNRIITDIRQGGNYSVGVAAMNSGGISIITYSQNIELPNFSTAALGMTGIIGVSVGGVVVFFLLIFLVLTIVICCIKARNNRMTSSIALGAGSPSTKKKPTTPVHKLHRGESSSPGSEHHNMYTMEPGAAESPLPYSLQTSTSNMNVQYSVEPRAAGSPSPPPVTDPATVTFGK